MGQVKSLTLSSERPYLQTARKFSAFTMCTIPHVPSRFSVPTLGALLESASERIAVHCMLFRNTNTVCFLQLQKQPSTCFAAECINKQKCPSHFELYRRLTLKAMHKCHHKLTFRRLMSTIVDVPHR